MCDSAPTLAICRVDHFSDPDIHPNRHDRRRAMVHKKKGRAAPEPVIATAVVMVLYVTESGPNSARAAANLEAICKEHLQGNFQLETIDVFQHPQRALADGVVVAPSLAKLFPLPAARIVGNLSDKSGVMRALGIAE
jgi:circadian clock protein KaiB